MAGHSFRPRWVKRQFGSVLISDLLQRFAVKVRFGEFAEIAFLQVIRGRGGGEGETRVFLVIGRVPYRANAAAFTATRSENAAELGDERIAMDIVAVARLVAAGTCMRCWALSSVISSASRIMARMLAIRSGVAADGGSSGKPSGF